MGTGISKQRAVAAKRCFASPGRENAERQLGDLLLALAGWRGWKVDPEIALNGAVNRFIDRFEAVEREITKTARFRGFG